MATKTIRNLQQDNDRAAANTTEKGEWLFNTILFSFLVLLLVLACLTEEMSRRRARAKSDRLIPRFEVIVEEAKRKQEQELLRRPPSEPSPAPTQTNDITDAERVPKVATYDYISYKERSDGWKKASLNMRFIPVNEDGGSPPAVTDDRTDTSTTATAGYCYRIRGEGRRGDRVTRIVDGYCARSGLAWWKEKTTVLIHYTNINGQSATMDYDVISIGQFDFDHHHNTFTGKYFGLILRNKYYNPR